MLDSPDSSNSRLWHPFANMATVRGHEFVLVEADGVWVTDSTDKRYLDATAALWYANVGHGRPEIKEAIDDQLDRIGAYSIFGDFTNVPALELAELVADRAPMVDPRVFLTSGGGDSIETAAKVARKYWSEVGQPNRTTLITRLNGYHGTHGFGTSIAGIEANRSGYGRLLPDTSVVAPNSLDALEREIDRLGADRVAAFFVEPVIGAGGVILPADNYLDGVADICERTGVLLIADEVICGFGRLGTWFGVERFGIEPDMIAFAKGVTSGYLPLGGLVVNGRVAEPFWEDGGTFFRHGPTYAGHPTCCAAAIANIGLLEDGLLERGRELESHLADALLPLAENPLVSEVRAGLGLLAAVELSPRINAIGGGVTEVAMLARENGVLVRPLASSLAISPPLTIEHSEMDLIQSALLGALEKFAHLHANDGGVAANY